MSKKVLSVSIREELLEYINGLDLPYGQTSKDVDEFLAEKYNFDNAPTKETLRKQTSKELAVIEKQIGNLDRRKREKLKFMEYLGDDKGE